MLISQAAFDLIVQEETGGQAYYNKTEISTDWPGGASGCTIGIGYDCGYSTKAQIAADWGDKLSASMITALQDTAGVTGSAASALAHELKGIVKVPWDVALDVFKNRDVPKWEMIVRRALPNVDKLSADSFGALVSLAFNRGASFSNQGDRYAEMRSIHDHMANGQFNLIPGDFRSMKRIWVGTSAEADLTARREHEAVLFERGLSKPPMGSTAIAPLTNATKHGAGAIVVAGGTVAAAAAQSHGVGTGGVIAILIVAAMAGAAIWVAIHKHQQQNKAK